MLVRDVMESQLEVIAPSATVAEAAQKMRDADIGSLPVVEDAKLIGMVTDRDIVIRCVAEGADPRATSVREAATPDVVHCLVDQSVEDASKIMAAAKVRRLPVIDHDRRLVGIVALGDISWEGSATDAGDALHDISEPTRASRTV
jgi:CBS domain-containing protein